MLLVAKPCLYEDTAFLRFGVLHAVDNFALGQRLLF